MSQRAFQMCGVMQFCCASQRSVSASLIIPWTIEPPLRRGTSQRATQSGAPFGSDCWTTTSSAMPLFQRQRFIGRSLQCGTISSATRA